MGASRALLRNNYVKLLDINAQEMLDFLFQGFVIENDEKQSIEIQDTDKNKARKLLDIIIRKGEKAASCFVEALEKFDSECYKKLAPTNSDEIRYQGSVQSNNSSIECNKSSITTLTGIHEATEESLPSTITHTCQDTGLINIENKGNGTYATVSGTDLQYSNITSEESVEHYCEESATSKAGNKRHKELSLLVIGKTGNGKSATANSLLLADKDIFKTGDSCTPITHNIQKESSVFRNHLITVIDSPGIGEKINDVEQTTKIITEPMEDILRLNPEGYHAVILVARYGGRFTEEDRECLRILKTIYGQNFVKDFCILLITYGDIFEAKHLKHKKTLDEWCSEQEGYFREMLVECDGRVVLFDNVTTDVMKREKQLEELIDLVSQLQNEKYRYDMSKYKLVNKVKARDELQQEFFTLITTSNKSDSDSYQDQIDELDNKIEQMKKLREKCVQLDESSISFPDLIQMIDNALRTLEYNTAELKKLRDKKGNEKDMREMIITEINGMSEQLMSLVEETEKFRTEARLEEEKYLKRKEEEFRHDLEKSVRINVSDKQVNNPGAKSEDHKNRLFCEIPLDELQKINKQIFSKMKIEQKLSEQRMKDIESTHNTYKFKAQEALTHELDSPEKQTLKTINLKRSIDEINSVKEKWQEHTHFLKTKNNRPMSKCLIM